MRFQKNKKNKKNILPRTFTTHCRHNKPHTNVNNVHCAQLENIHLDHCSSKSLTFSSLSLSLPSLPLLHTQSAPSTAFLLHHHHTVYAPRSPKTKHVTRHTSHVTRHTSSLRIFMAALLTKAEIPSFQKRVSKRFTNSSSVRG